MFTGLSRHARVAIALALVGLQGCSSSGSGGEPTGRLELVSISVLPGQIQAVNVPLEFEFNKPIDLATANLSTILIEPIPSAQVEGEVIAPVQGEFFGQGNKLYFQPLCPDAYNPLWGFQPGEELFYIQYQITLLGAETAQPTLLQATDGSQLSQSTTLDFRTPTPPAAFVQDPLPGSPPRVNLAEPLPVTLGLNLFSNPNSPLEITLDQPVFPGTIDDGAILLSFEDPGLGTVNIPAEVVLTRNCTVDGEARLTVTTQGILPSGREVQFYLSKQVEGLGGGNDTNPADVLFHTATVQEASRPLQPDAILENFDDQEGMNPNPTLLTPIASWGNGRLQSAPTFTGPLSSITIEIGPGTTNGEVVSFDTNGATLKDTTGNLFFFGGGVIEVGDFVMKNPRGKNSRFEVTGPNPLIIRASNSVFLGGGSVIDVRGSDGPDMNGVGGLAGSPSQGGPGKAGGGDGGNGSPQTLKSSALGQDGFGPYQVPAGGGKGGHSAFGWTNNGATQPGGGGGGNAGSFEVNADGDLVAFCWGVNRWEEDCDDNNPTGCNSGQPQNTLGEKGANGSQSTANTLCVINGDDVSHLDAVDGSCWAAGGQPGPLVFLDGDPENDFSGRKARTHASGDVFVIPGELTQPLPGQGGGGGGDNVPNLEFPSQTFPGRDLRGAGGGGGGGCISIESLGKITVRGKIWVNGGRGGQGQITFNNAVISGGGGGGSGGSIILESRTEIEIGQNGELKARGGNRGIGGGTLPGFNNGDGCNNGRKNETSGKGGAGAKGVVVLRLPVDPATTITCGGITQPAIANGALVVDDKIIRCERDLSIAGSKKKNIRDRFDPAPHVLLPTFGTTSGAQSDWYYLGWSSLTGPTQFDFDGIDLATGTIDPTHEEVLAGGNGGVITAADYSLTLDNQALADLIRSEPAAIIGNGFRPNPGEFPRTIVQAGVSGSEVSLDLDPAEMALGGVGSWEVLERHFRTLLNGRSANSFPASARIQVFFQGARTLGPGSILPDPATITAETPDITTLIPGGYQLLRFRVELEANAQGDPLGSLLDLPGLDFLRLPIPY